MLDENRRKIYFHKIDARSAVLKADIIDRWIRVKMKGTGNWSVSAIKSNLNILKICAADGLGLEYSLSLYINISSDMSIVAELHSCAAA